MQFKQWDAWHHSFLLVNLVYIHQSPIFSPFLVQRPLHKSQGFFFSPSLSLYASVSFPHASRVRMSQDIALPWSSVPFQTAFFFFFYPYRSLVQVPNSVPFCTLPRRQCGTFENRRYFSAGGLWEAQVWSWLDDWLIQGVSSLVSRWRELFTLRHAAPKCGT